MEIRKGIFELAKWPLTTAQNMGSFVLEVMGREDTGYKLQVDEPVSRAMTALTTAVRAINKSKPDQDLARFEVMRAAVAVDDISMMNPELAVELGQEVIGLALELPDNEVNFKIAEQATGDSLDKLMRNHIPYQRLPSE